jgi:opacity protein-like surface antigen
MALAAVFSVAFTPAQAQGRDSGRPMPETEIVVESGQSFGNIHLFAYADDRSLNPYGVEFDRHSWGGLLTARVDYVAEILPVVLLNEPAKYGADSEPLTTARQVQYGAGFSPVGVRLLWRRDRALKPYLIGKGGILYFQNRVLSTEGSHLNFSAQFGAGIETRLTRRVDLRLGYSDFHMSNGDIVARNPGIDFMYANAALAFRFGR